MGMFQGYHFPFFILKLSEGMRVGEDYDKVFYTKEKILHSKKLTCSKLKQPVSSNFQFLRENYKIKTSLKFSKISCKTPKFIWEKLASKLDVLFEI